MVSSSARWAGQSCFSADDGTTGQELWKSDGTATGTVLVKDINPAINLSPSSDPQHLTDVNGTLFFSTLVLGDALLWKSDGTQAGTVLVKDFRATPGTQESPLYSLTNFDGALYFTADDGIHGSELWKSDGTTAGTFLVKDINPGSASSFPFDLTNVNGTLYFSANDGLHGRGLWKSDGTAAGTVPVADVVYPSDLTNVNGTLYFTASDNDRSIALWKSDGTPAGTVMVSDQFFFGSPRSLTNVNGTLFFTASDGYHGFEVWKSDGTDTGTVIVKDINPDSFGIYSQGELTNVNGTLYFTDNSDFPHQLWKTDGTPAGTKLVTVINPSTGGAINDWLTNVNGTLFFVNDDGVHGFELWKSDGTTAGTVLVKDINPGPNGSNPTLLTNVNGTLYFRADDGVHGNELWKSDGTAAGTVLVQDVNPGSQGSNSYGDSLTNVNGNLFFTANNSVHGRELWWAPVNARPDQAQTPEATPVTVSVLANDTVALGGATVLGTTTPAHGSAVINARGTITYTPAAGFNGVDSFTYTVGDAFGNTDTAVVSLTVFLEVNPATVAATLQSDVTAANAVTPPAGTPQVFVHLDDPASMPAFVAALANLSVNPAGPVIDVVLDVGAGAYSLGNVSVPAGLRLVIDGTGPGTFTASSTPALTLVSGDVIIRDGAVFGSTGNAATIRVQGGQLTVQDSTIRKSAGAAPTLLVEGGRVTVRGSTIEETPAGNQAAISISGGLVDLGATTDDLLNNGSANDPGQNTIAVHGSGLLIRNSGPNDVSAVGNTFSQDGVAFSDNYRIEDAIDHSMDGLDSGTVFWVPNNVFVSVNHGNVQRGVDLVPSGGTVNVESGAHGDFAAGTKLLTIASQDGAFMTQQANSLDPTQTTVMVWGTYGTVAAGLRLVIDGGVSGTFTASSAPILKLLSGDVVIGNGALLTSTANAPTILVKGGHLTIRNSTIEETSGGNQAALSISGGQVDLGTDNDPGGNAINVQGKGLLIRNTGPNDVSAVGNWFSQDGVGFADNYRIEDAIDHSMDGLDGGTVFWITSNVFVSVNHGNVQRGVDLVPSGGTVNVETGVHGNFSAGAKLLTIAFEDGSSMTQQIDDLDSTLRTLVVTGTFGNDTIKFKPGDDRGVRVEMNHVPHGTFLPTGRLIAYGVDGSDTIEVSDDIHLSAWLFGGYSGNNFLKGGGGNDVLVGGIGNDTLTAGSGRDLLIGDGGTDQLDGKSGDDILIGGYCAFAGSYGTDETGVAALMAEWTSADNYLTRVNYLVNGGGLNGSYTLTPGVTVFDDGAGNVLDGGPGQDLFFAGLTDTVKGQQRNETVLNL